MPEIVPHKLPGNIFMQPWWLNIVASNEWQDITIKKGGELFARWPVVCRSKKGFNFIEMPVLTQKLGPWIKQTSSKKEAIHRNERSTLGKLIKKLPEFDKFSYNLNIDNQNYLPFIWSGFQQKSFTTFQIQYPYTSDNAWNNFKSSVRRDIRRAEEELSIQEVTPEVLYEMILLTFKRQGLQPKYSKEVLTKLCYESIEKGRGQLFGVFDSSGKIHAAQFLVHDDDTSYYLAGGFDPESDIPGAVSLLLWNSIKEAEKRKNTFDFEGSSIEPIEYFFSSFGAKQVLIHNITGYSKKYALIHFSKLLIKTLKN